MAANDVDNAPCVRVPEEQSDFFGNRLARNDCLRCGHEYLAPRPSTRSVLSICREINE